MIISDFEIKCDYCGREYNILADTLEIDFAYDDDRPMGTEVQHIFYGERECQCGYEMSYTITAVEYPEGAYDFHVCESQGCSYVVEPSVEMEYIPEPVLSVYEEIIRNPNILYDLESWEFEEFIADVFQQYGFKAEVTQRTRDGGKDIVAQFEIGGVRYTTYFECKQYSQKRPVGVNVIRELYAVMSKDCVDKGIIVTTSYFTRDAIAEANSLNGRIKLIDYDELKNLIEKII